MPQQCSAPVAIARRRCLRRTAICPPSGGVHRRRILAPPRPCTVTGPASGRLTVEGWSTSDYPHRQPVAAARLHARLRTLNPRHYGRLRRPNRHPAPHDGRLSPPYRGPFARLSPPLKRRDGFPANRASQAERWRRTTAAVARQPWRSRSERQYGWLLRIEVSLNQTGSPARPGRGQRSAMAWVEAGPL